MIVAVSIGDVYEDCAYHPVWCTGVDRTNPSDHLWTGVSLLDGSRPRTCSARHCQVRILTTDEVANRIQHRDDWLAALSVYRDSLDSAPLLQLVNGSVENLLPPPNRPMRRTTTLRILAQAILTIDQNKDCLYGLSLAHQSGLCSGTLYPLVKRLKQHGWLEPAGKMTQPGAPPRHLLRLTELGRQELTALIGK